MCRETRSKIKTAKKDEFDSVRTAIRAEPNLGRSVTGVFLAVDSDVHARLISGYMEFFSGLIFCRPCWHAWTQEGLDWSFKQTNLVDSFDWIGRKALQGYAVKQGEIACQSVYKGLLNLYARCGAFDECWKLFEQLNHRDVVTWNIILSGYCRSQIHDTKAIRLFVKMHAEGEVKPSAITIASILPVCSRVGKGVVGKSIHSFVMKSGLDRDTLVGNALISMYAKSGQPWYDAYAAFNSIIHKDVVTWNTIISALAEKNLMFDALQLFSLMLEEPIEPNYITIACILPVCASFGNNVSCRFGKEIHGYIHRRTELIEDISVCNALMNLYLRVGQMEEAEILFSHLKQRDLVSWNTLISGYSLNDKWLEAVDHFCKLLCLGSDPDSVTLISVLPACAYSQNLRIGKMIHGYILRHPVLSEDSTVGNALVSFYTKCNDVKSAFHSFSLISSKDLISWNSVLNAFAEFGNTTQFPRLLHLMLRERFKPDHFTILSIINFCITVLGGCKVKEVHCYSVRACLFEADYGPTILNALLDAYSKCGIIDYALKIFESSSGKRNLVTCNSMISCYVNCKSPNDALTIFSGMSETDLTTWNLMIRVYAENNCPRDALGLFRRLQIKGMKPDAWHCRLSQFFRLHSIYSLYITIYPIVKSHSSSCSSEKSLARYFIDITNAARKVPLDKKKLDDDASLINTQGVGGCNPISRCRGIGIKDEIIRDIKRRGRTKRKSPPKA
ncbi:hypothetical protein Csa_014928 [Cucumis sativus]|nr:hypothetical protein Csa_014928 [Cucumis sativus]